MESDHLRLLKLSSMHAHALLVGHCCSGLLQVALSACSSLVIFAPIYNTKFLWNKKPLSSHFLDLFSQQPGSLLNDVHDDIRVSIPSVRLHIATKRPAGCWELDGTEELFQETLISLLIILVHNLNQSVSYLVCSFQASNNLSGFPFDFIITLLL